MSILKKSQSQMSIRMPLESSHSMHSQQDPPSTSNQPSNELASKYIKIVNPSQQRDQQIKGRYQTSLEPINRSCDEMGSTQRFSSQQDIIKNKEELLFVIALIFYFDRDKMSQSLVMSPEMLDIFKVKKELLIKHKEKLIENNQAYFRIVSGGKVCGSCIKPKELALDYKKGGMSLYQKDYVKHDSSARVPRTTFKLHETFDHKQPMELKTTNRVDYRVHPMESNPSYKTKDPTQFLPFNGSSSYNYQYPNWGSNPVSQMKPPNHPTVLKDMPFIGKSFYRQEYIPMQVEKDEARNAIIQMNRKGQFKSPINSEFPFQSSTSYRTTYLPKSSQTKSCKQNRKADPPLPQFAGQYQTVHNKDYTNKSALCKCTDTNCAICNRKISR